MDEVEVIITLAKGTRLSQLNTVEAEVVVRHSIENVEINGNMISFSRVKRTQKLSSQK